VIVVVFAVYRGGQLCVELLPELNEGSSSKNDTTCVPVATSGIGVKDPESSSSVSSKEGSGDVKHFIEVVFVLMSYISECDHHSLLSFC